MWRLSLFGWFVFLWKKNIYRSEGVRDFVTWLAHNRSTVDRACRSVVESSLVVRVFLCVRSTSSSCSTVAVHWAWRWPDWRCTHFVWRTKDSSSMWRWRFLASAASCWPPCYRCRCSCWGRDIIKMPCEYHPTNVLHDLRVLNTLWKTKTSQSYTRELLRDVILVTSMLATCSSLMRNQGI